MNENNPTNRLSIYLIKSNLSDHGKILKDVDNLKSKEIDGIGIFYFGESHIFKPTWIRKFFGLTLDDENALFNASSKGVLLVNTKINAIDERVFAITFGYGWTFLSPGVWEERFGLKVALNSIDENHLRRIDKKNMASIPKDTSEQLSKEGVVADFGIDIEQDLIQSITGKSKDENFGKTVTGKDALSVSVKVGLSNLQDFLKKCFKTYESDVYKKNFGWIDQIAEIEDPALVESLSLKLIEEIKNKNFDKIWMAVPEIVEWNDIEGFAYKNKKEDLEDDIYLEAFLNSLSEEEKGNLDLGTFERKMVSCYSVSSDELKYQWKAFNCLYCEIQDEEKNKTYLLSNGRWYEIEKDFALQVNSDYQQFRDKEYEYSLPSYTHKNEPDYNEKIATNSGGLFFCMDMKNISHGGGYSKIEFCDLISSDNKIIHVKRYGGSSVLSHLFSQGVVSGELFLADEKFREKVNNLLPKANKLADIKIRPNPRDYEVVFAVISSSKKDLELPFFSKVNLRNAKRRLETYGYKVYLLKIEVEKDTE